MCPCWKTARHPWQHPWLPTAWFSGCTHRQGPTHWTIGEGADVETKLHAWLPGLHIEEGSSAASCFQPHAGAKRPCSCSRRMGFGCNLQTDPCSSSHHTWQRAKANMTQASMRKAPKALRLQMRLLPYAKALFQQCPHSVVKIRIEKHLRILLASGTNQRRVQRHKEMPFGPRGGCGLRTACNERLAWIQFHLLSHVAVACILSKRQWTEPLGQKESFVQGLDIQLGNFLLHDLRLDKHFKNSKHVVRLAACFGKVWSGIRHLCPNVLRVADANAQRSGTFPQTLHTGFHHGLLRKCIFSQILIKNAELAGLTCLSALYIH